MTLITKGFEQFKSQHNDSTSPWDWQRDVLQLLAKIRKQLFPIHIDK